MKLFFKNIIQIRKYNYFLRLKLIFGTTKDFVWPEIVGSYIQVLSTLIPSSYIYKFDDF